MIDFKKLAEPFSDEDLEWRISQVFNKSKLSARVLVYVTNRAIMSRLDEVCGPENWCNEYKQIPGAFLCGLSIRVGEEWVTKWDGAQESQIEATKGGLSGAMKRTAVQWGIGRYLYNVGDFWADINDNGDNYQGGKNNEYPAFKWNAPRLGQKSTNTPTQGKPQQKPAQAKPKAPQLKIDELVALVDKTFGTRGADCLKELTTFGDPGAEKFMELDKLSTYSEKWIDGAIKKVKDSEPF